MNQVSCAGTAAPSNTAELHITTQLLALGKYQLPGSKDGAKLSHDFSRVGSKVGTALREPNGNFLGGRD